ncbi:hypothetical protein BOQ63_007055 (plasmid) [Streptomyces viridifaciens]|uniref:hypothetical protein n=1 Tax=Kitasatospora aureofaciens TaxID=1894 RepID=UPI000ACB719F|nr:hypothetical protein BOQ63_007055 [Streptomyces viridifaciens]
MIPGPHRLKGGALQLGAEEPGLPGPFGTWTDSDDREHKEPEADEPDDGQLWC